jgi:PAS domain S-box-containing protein
MKFYQKGIFIFKKPITVGILVFLALFTILQAISYQRYTILKNEETTLLHDQAELTKNKILSVLYDNIYILKSLVYIAQNKEITNEFNEIAENILPTEHVIDAIELTKQGVITQVYPYEENKSVLGYDIFSEEIHKIPAYKAIEKKSFYFEGPVLLSKGGIAIIGRLPYYRNEKFAGFAIGIIKLDELINIAAINTDNKSDYIYGISKFNTLKNENEFFLSNESFFNDFHYVSVNIPSGDWSLHVRPKKLVGLQDVFLNILFGVIISLLGGLFAWFISAQPIYLNKLVNEKIEQLNKNEQLMIKTQKLANVGSWEIDLNTKSVIWSKSLMEILEASETLVPSLQLLVNLFNIGYNRDKISFLLNDAIKNGNYFSVELALHTFNNNYKWVRLNGDVERNNEDEIIRLFGAIQDITQEKQVNSTNENLSIQLKEISETIPGVIYQLKISADNSFSFVYISEGINNLLLLDLNEVYEDADKFLSLIHPDDLSNFKRSFLSNIIGKGQNQTVTFRIFVNNQILYINSNASSSLIEGELIWNGSFTDVTEIKNAEQEKTYLGGLLANISDGIISTDEDFVIKSWNFGAERIFGWKANEVIGKKFHAVLKTQYLNITNKLVKKNFYETGFFIDEVMQIDKLGIYHQIAMSSTLFRDKQNEVTGAVAVIRNIDDIKNSEKNSVYKTNLLSTIGLVNSIFLNNNDWSKSLEIAFELIGLSLKAHRIVYYETAPNENDIDGLNQKMEWVFDQKLEIRPNLINLTLKDIQVITEDVNKQDYYTAITSDLPNGKLKDMFLEKLIKSLILLPVNTNNSKVGFIVVEDMKLDREWSDEEIYFLKTITNNISSSIQKRENNDALELANSEKTLILESIMDAFFAIDNNWQVTYWNKVAEDLFQKKKVDILGKNIWDMLFKTENNVFKEHFYQSSNSRLSSHFETYFLEGDVWLEVSVFPSAAGLSVFFKNINERIEYVKEIQKQNENLKEISWIQSHVVRAPLARLMGLVSIKNEITHDELGEEEYFGLIMNSANELDDIIKTITDKSQYPSLLNQEEKIKPSFKE